MEKEIYRRGYRLQIEECNDIEALRELALSMLDNHYAQEDLIKNLMIGDFQTFTQQNKEGRIF